MKKALVLLVALMVLASPFSVMGATGVLYTSGFQVQNLAAAPASIVVDFYDSTTGLQVANASISDTIPAGQMKVYFPLPSGVPEGFNGSAVISSDQQVAAITNVLGNGGQRGDSYAGASAGGSPVNLPLVMKGNYNNDTWFSVQNTGPTDATVNVAYNGTSCTEQKVIKPNAAASFDQATNTCLPATYVGSATVTSNQPVAVVVMEVGPANLLAYAGFVDASTAPVMPLIMTANFNNFTGASIMNTGATATTVTVSYTPATGQPGAACTETKPLNPGQSLTFGYPTMPAGCGSPFVGSGKVTGNTANMPLVAIVNQVNSNGNASAYNAFDAAKATNRVSLPLIMDRNYGLYTGVSVVNMGTQPTNISCTFSGTAYTMTGTNVAPGGSISAVQKDQIAAGYVGAGTCTATGGDAKIAAIVNQVKAAAAGNDVLFTYPGFSY